MVETIAWYLQGELDHSRVSEGWCVAWISQPSTVGTTKRDASLDRPLALGVWDLDFMTGVILAALLRW